MKVLPKNISHLEYPCPICLLTKATKIARNTAIDVLTLPSPPRFMLQMDVAVLMLKSSVDLPRLLWLYVFLLHTTLDLHPEANVRLLAS